MTINRRQAVIRLATLMGATAISPRVFAALAEEKKVPASSPLFTAADILLLDEIGETIIPATDIPGARATQIGAFMTMMITDCYEPLEQKAFTEGLRHLESTYRARYKENFVGGSAENRTAYLNELDGAQKAARGDKKGKQTKAATAAPQYFRLMKELTILGYFTSEIGSTKALRFIEIPGRYDGCAPYKPGEHAFAYD